MRYRNGGESIRIRGGGHSINGKMYSIKRAASSAINEDGGTVATWVLQYRRWGRDTVERRRSFEGAGRILTTCAAGTNGPAGSIRPA